MSLAWHILFPCVSVLCLEKFTTFALPFILFLSCSSSPEYYVAHWCPLRSYYQIICFLWCFGSIHSNLCKLIRQIISILFFFYVSNDLKLLTMYLPKICVSIWWILPVMFKKLIATPCTLLYDSIWWILCLHKEEIRSHHGIL